MLEHSTASNLPLELTTQIIKDMPDFVNIRMKSETNGGKTYLVAGQLAEQGGKWEKFKYSLVNKKWRKIGPEAA